MTSPSKNSVNPFKNRIPSGRTARITIEELYDMLVKKRTLHPNPIHQRASTISVYQHPKNEGIINTIINGIGIDSLILRDISGCDADDPIRKLYPNIDYLVIDGGHRCRAVTAFMRDQFHITIDGVDTKYSDLTHEEKTIFLDTCVTVKYVPCNSEHARETFLAINKMTKTNEIETIMADDTNPVCRWVREQTWYYPEYQNKKMIHPIFRVSTSNDSEHISNYWNKANIGGSFYYHAFIALAKVIGHGNVDAGQTVWQELVAKKKPIKNKDKKIWSKFFDDLKEYQDVINHSGKLNDEIFGFFACVWFELMSRYGIDGFKFIMNDVVRDVSFAKDLARKRSELTCKFDKSGNNKYDEMSIQNLDGVTTDIKSTIREYIKAFSCGAKQSFAGRFILDEMGEDPMNFGVIIIDTRKNPSRKDRELILNQQKNICFIDKRPLKLNDAHAAHIKARSAGGVSDISNYKMVRKSHNQRMGTMNLYDYKNIYEKKYA